MADRSQTSGYAAGASAEAFSEGPALCRLHGPSQADDSPRYGGDNDSDDAYHQSDVWQIKPFPANPGSKDKDSLG